jgi:hypothetical protein
MARTRVGGVHKMVGDGEAGGWDPQAPHQSLEQSGSTEIVPSTNFAATSGDKTSESFLVPRAIARQHG